MFESPEKECVIRMSSSIHRYISSKAASERECDIGQLILNLKIYRKDERALAISLGMQNTAQPLTHSVAIPG